MEVVFVLLQGKTTQPLLPSASKQRVPSSYEAMCRRCIVQITPLTDGSVAKIKRLLFARFQPLEKNESLSFGSRLILLILRRLQDWLNNKYGIKYQFQINSI